MSRHKTSYVISYHGILCHDMLYVTTIAASLLDSNCMLGANVNEHPQIVMSPLNSSHVKCVIVAAVFN